MGDVISFMLPAALQLADFQFFFSCTSTNQEVFQSDFYPSRPHVFCCSWEPCILFPLQPVLTWPMACRCVAQDECFDYVKEFIRSVGGKT